MRNRCAGGFRVAGRDACRRREPVRVSGQSKEPAMEPRISLITLGVAAFGATITRPGHPTDWGGYSGYFTGLDGFLWEVAHNPAFPHV
jgi:hypothetical protein